MQIQEILNQVSAIVADELVDNFRVFMFGSRAKGIGHEKSDIDIGIISATPITGKHFLAIQEKIEQIPTLLKIDVVDFNSVDNEFKKIALKYTVDI